MLKMSENKQIKTSFIHEFVNQFNQTPKPKGNLYSHCRQLNGIYFSQFL